MRVIEEGYKLPFVALPVPARFNNNRSALVHEKFVDSAIAGLCWSGRVVECAVPPTIVNPLSVSVQANSKKRLILDLRFINKFLHWKRVKYEDWKVALSYFALGAYMFAFDFKSGCHHIEIAICHKRFFLD